MDDFEPDEVSEIQEDGTRAGYVWSVDVNAVLHSLRPRTETASFDVETVGPKIGKKVDFQFSRAHRDDWYLRDESDRVVGNLWDQFAKAITLIQETTIVEVAPPTPQFLVLGGSRVRFKSLSMEVEVSKHEHHIRVDLGKDAFGYENAATGEVKIVPMPARVLDAVVTKGGG